MPLTLYDTGEGKEAKKRASATSIAPGKVVNNCDLIMQGKVLVRIPSIDREVWARLTAIGAGDGRGFLFNPQIDDEVLVAFQEDDPNDAFLLGGLWSTKDSPPVSAPTDTLTKRVIKSGLTKGTGHELELDDAMQSVTITTSLKQTIKLGPTGIQILSGTNSITIAPPTGPGSVQIVVGAGASANAISIGPSGITLAASQNISLSAPNISILGTNVTITGPGSVRINS